MKLRKQMNLLIFVKILNTKTVIKVEVCLNVYLVKKKRVWILAAHDRSIDINLMKSFLFLKKEMSSEQDFIVGLELFLVALSDLLKCYHVIIYIIVY